jgi:ribosomal protein S18 acetylase RimI-like enzyme
MSEVSSPASDGRPSDEKEESGTKSINLRPAGPDDEEFLYRVYAGTRAREMALVDWDDEKKEQFIRMQFSAQSRHYRTHFADAEYLVIEKGKTGIGRLYVGRLKEEIRIIDIALIPEFRNSGIGGFLIRKIMDEGAAAGKPVRIHVERMNPALRLYERLGFVQIADLGVYLFMEWPPRTAS